MKDGNYILKVSKIKVETKTLLKKKIKDKIRSFPYLFIFRIKRNDKKIR